MVLIIFFDNAFNRREEGSGSELEYSPIHPQPERSRYRSDVFFNASNDSALVPRSWLTAAMSLLYLGGEKIHKSAFRRRVESYVKTVFYNIGGPSGLIIVSIADQPPVILRFF